MATSQAEYDRLVNELKEVQTGRRGWCNVNNARLESCGLNRGSLTVILIAFGLSATPHGRYGWTASAGN